MLYKVLDRFTAKTSQGEREILPGQTVTLSREQAEKLTGRGKVKPVDSSIHEYKAQDGRIIPFRIVTYPELNDYLLLVDGDEEAQAMKDSGVQEAIFSRREIAEIKNLPPGRIADHFRIRKTFFSSKIE